MELRRAPAHGAKAPTLARWIGLGRGSCGRTAPSAAAGTEGKDFAFTIIDATDNATLARIRPIYQLLSELRLRTTKTVWVYQVLGRCRGSHLPGVHPRPADAGILNRPSWRTWGEQHPRRHPASLGRYREFFNRPPRIHVNNAKNLDNLYWVSARVSRWRRTLRLRGALAAGSLGHDERSDFFWGDLCRGAIARSRAHRGTWARTS